MLSAAKHLSPCGGETLRCAQSDSLCCQGSEQRSEAISLMAHQGLPIP
jgi:hypothetical protein